MPSRVWKQTENKMKERMERQRKPRSTNLMYRELLEFLRKHRSRGYSSKELTKSFPIGVGESESFKSALDLLIRDNVVELVMRYRT